MLINILNGRSAWVTIRDYFWGILGKKCHKTWFLGSDNRNPMPESRSWKLHTSTLRELLIMTVISKVCERPPKWLHFWGNLGQKCHKTWFFGNMLIKNLGKRVESPNTNIFQGLLIITDVINIMKLTHRVRFWGVFSKKIFFWDFWDLTIEILCLRVEAQNLTQVHLESYW